ncbi:hypothetical protein [Aureispira sp. CCB-QB1]|uniref:hypothetical protein n=1 Tax=Aureispira sp. CCB-QB1 TaxID=1313421 RepID=UPI0012DD919F|nr:hypothetical protein [Aureispira sp. CCB-QB1]
MKEHKMEDNNKLDKNTMIVLIALMIFHLIAILLIYSIYLNEVNNNTLFLK